MPFLVDNTWVKWTNGKKKENTRGLRLKKT